MNPQDYQVFILHPSSLILCILMTTPTHIDEINKRGYASAQVVDWYNGLDFIYKTEAVLLERLWTAIKNKKLLDLGVGCGRTTRFLLEVSRDYTGIDYTPACIDAAKTKFPEANLFCGDARDLSAFPNDSFAFVLFSLNGLDYVVHEDRLRVLQEIFRVLGAGGFFMFSTHNRDYRHFNKLPWQEGFQLKLNFLKNCAYTLAFMARHFRLRRKEVHTDEYAIVNDNAHGFSLLSYYIGIDRQKAQLAAAGFVEIETYDMEARKIESDRDSPWAYYLAQKPGNVS
jgi:SAM-dependent methyltransferase